MTARGGHRKGTGHPSTTAHALAEHDEPGLAGTSRHNLPYLPSSFVGRREEFAEVRSRLLRSRLVTLTGPGGMGKTRLAVQVAARAVPDYPAGIWLAELAALAHADHVPQAVASVLPRREHHSRLQQSDDIVRQIGEQSLLLVLDNCEHLVAACAALADTLLRGCPGLRILATSREPLGIVGEHTWPVGPLSLPDPGTADMASVASSDAGELFLQRATATSPTFRLTETVAPAVTEICRRLDGMPLAIELAAARLGALSAADILERLDDRFRLLNAGGRTVAPRHQTLAATLQWSHDLLPPAEAVLLRRVSVFAGWTLDAAEEVCAGDAVARARIVDHLPALVSKSLVVVEPAEQGVRYRLLETVRAWAAAKLAVAPEGDSVRRRHAIWCVELAEEAEEAEEEIGFGRPQPWLDELDMEHDNLRGALEWARATGEVELGLRLATALTTFWRRRGHAREGVRWLEWGIAAGGDCPTPLRAKALRGAGLLRGLLGEVTRAIPMLEQSSALFTEAGDDGASLCACMPLFLMFRSPRQALPGLEEKIAFCRRTGDTSGLAHMLYTCGQAHFFLGEVTDARRRFEECVDVGRVGEDEAVSCGLFGLARVAILQGDYIDAEVKVKQARALAEDAGDFDDLAWAAGLLGDLARARGQWGRARRYLEKSVELARSGGWPLSVARALHLSACLVEGESECGGREAGALFERSLSLSHSAGGPGFHEARCLLGMGSAAQAEGDLSEAAGLFLEALESAQAIEDAQATADALARLATLARLEGKVDDARLLAFRALELRHRLGELPAIASSLELLAGLAADAARWDVAARLFGAAQVLRDTQGYARSRSAQAIHDADLDAVRQGAGADAFPVAWAEGAALSAEDAVSYAMRGRGTRDRPASGRDSLTPAECEVVRLVREGLTNPEVGRRLFISPRTVGHHLTHVYRKLGIHSRGALIRDPAAQDL